MDWNYTAIGDLFAFDHTLDHDTLTESLPYAAPIIEQAGGDLTALTVSILKESITNPGATVLSASGGFDSRLLLAALLHLGMPRGSDRLPSPTWSGSTRLDPGPDEPRSVGEHDEVRAYQANRPDRVVGRVRIPCPLVIRM